MDFIINIINWYGLLASTYFFDGLWFFQKLFDRYTLFVIVIIIIRYQKENATLISQLI